MAKQIKLIPNQSHYTCLSCSKSKPASEFYVSRARKNGLQANCKTCCKEKNSEFRFRRPSYYWGDDKTVGYFQLNYDKLKEIIRKSQAADKTNKIYAIPTPDGTYIGATSRHLSCRKADHKKSYFTYRKGSRKVLIPKLYEVLDKYTTEEVRHMFNLIYIIEEWEGTRADLMKREGEIIKDFVSKNVLVLNSNKI